MRRGLLIIALGVGFIIAVTWLGTFVTTYIPHRDTPQVQTAQAGPYTVTLRVDPNPPSIEQPAQLSIQIQQSASHQPLNGAHVVVDGSMPSMDMDTTEVPGHEQGQGRYVASMPFSMSGPWQIQVLISLPDQATQNAIFTVTTQ